MALKELVTNADGRLSTTTTVQFLTFLTLAGTLIYSVYLDRTYVPDLFLYLAGFGGGLVATKGAVSAYKAAKESEK